MQLLRMIRGVSIVALIIESTLTSKGGTIMTKLSKILLIIASIIFLIFGVFGVFGALIALPYLADYNITHPANLPWEVYYGLVFLGSFNYFILGLCGIIFRNEIEKHSLLKVLCFGALTYILVSAILWFAIYAGAYDEHISIAITEIALGLITSFILLFSVSKRSR
jgi:hypothetical protein